MFSRAPAFIARSWAAPVLLVLAVLAVYGQTLGFDLVWDDPLLLAHIRASRAEGALLTADYGYLEVESIGYWRPLHVLSLTLDDLAGGGAPVVFRTGSLLLYLGVVLALFALGRSLLGPGPGAFLAALLFAVWPPHTESLGMVTNRHDLLAALSCLLAAALWARSRGRPPGWGEAASAGAFYLLGAFAKESALVLPGALLLWDLCDPRPSAGEGWWRRNSRWVLALGGAAALATLLRLAVFGTALGTPQGLARVTLHPGQLAGRTAASLSLLVIPWPVRVLYGPAQIGLSFGTAAGALIFLLLCAATAGRAQGRWGLRAAGWVGVFLLPVSGIVPAGGAPLAARYLFLASAGSCLLLGYLLQELARRAGGSAPVMAGAVLAAVVLGTGSFVQERVWRNEETLFRRIAADAPELGEGPFNLGVLRAREGRFSEAADLFRLARAKGRTDPKATGYLGLALLQAGSPAEALIFLRAAAAGQPRSFEVRNALAVALLRTGDPEGAVRELGALASGGMDPPDLYHNLGAAFARLGRGEEAVRAYRDGLRRHPGNQQLQEDLGRAP